ncbi:Nuclease-related domain-containing protein [Alkalibacterium subtropicum]|uniref:Nuclease-related domain-containing protein n=1 Tax=Alkalibacterium subtropicum TaxID=753702 RepID=A0A1I1GDP6_9LACT|nr:nuclease-related domain-containing protein [Alkalibacterium subtropicum]SFC09585.1 Nuclease-related domain-containing protein [Alkalibacterium subtropicum]
MLVIPIMIVLFTVVIILLPSYLRFIDTTYEKASGNSFFETFSNKGNWGEFKIYAKLEHIKIKKHVMTNLYIPTEKGHTTEVDLVMINQRGIFVFESKNYSGWIFGSENRKQWMQTFKNGTKNQFFNPIWQNKGHVKALMTASGLEDANYYYSYIVFGDDCTLKDITVLSDEVKVIKQSQLTPYLIRDLKAMPSILTYQQVDTIYANLKKYQLADDATKALHIEKLKAIHNK